MRRENDKYQGAQCIMGAQLSPPELSLSSLTPASPYHLNSGFSQGHLFPWGGPDQLWPQAWLGSPLPMGQGTGNGGLWGSSPAAPIHLLPAAWHIRDPCVCSPSQGFGCLVLWLPNPHLAERKSWVHPAVWRVAGGSIQERFMDHQTGLVPPRPPQPLPWR